MANVDLKNKNRVRLSDKVPTTPANSLTTPKVASTKSSHTEGKQWDRFLTYAQEYKDDENKEKGVQVWLDKDLKNKLDRLKASGIELPVKHLLSAALRVFLEDNEKQVNEQLLK
jgi:hypothetical protein